jgi:hypothetical protein
MFQNVSKEYEIINSFSWAKIALLHFIFLRGDSWCNWRSNSQDEVLELAICVKSLCVPHNEFDGGDVRGIGWD